VTVGSLKAGAVVVPTNPLYTVRELHNQLADSGARVVVVLSRLYPQVAEAATGTSVERIVVTNVKEHFPAALRVLFTVARERKEGHRVDISGDPRAMWLKDMLADRSARMPVDVAPADLAVLQYTCGTTVVPKCAMLSHRALVANVHQCKAWHAAAGNGDRILAIMPFFHVYGLTVVMNLAALRAMTMVLIPRPELRHIFLAIQKHRPRFFPGAPRIYILLNDSPELAKYDLRSIEWFLSGSAPLPVEVMRRFEQLTGGKVLVTGGCCGLQATAEVLATSVADAVARAILAGRLEAAPRLIYCRDLGPGRGRFSGAVLRGLHLGSLALYRRSRSYQRLRSLPVVTALTERVHSFLGSAA